jgi:hypothetical protein
VDWTVPLLGAGLVAGVLGLAGVALIVYLPCFRDRGRHRHPLISLRGIVRACRGNAGNTGYCRQPFASNCR